MRIRLFILLVGLAVLAGIPGFVPGEVPSRAIILSWDGVVPAFVNELMREGALPNLRRLIAEGAYADEVVTVFPSKTAPGHASLWTGAPPRINGVHGNATPRTPRGAFTILEAQSGFASTALRAEPLWMAAARSARRVVIVQATQGWPFEPYLRDGPFGPGQPTRLVLLEGYAGILGREMVLNGHTPPPRPAEGWATLPPSNAPPREITLSIGSARMFGLLIDDPTDPARGYDTLVVTATKDVASPQARLKPGGLEDLDRWSGTIELGSGDPVAPAVRMRLFDLRPDGSDYLLYVTRPVRELASLPALLPGIRRSAGVFIGNGASGPYTLGLLGRPIPQGGDGTAERRYLETVLLVQRQLMGATRWAMEHLPWDLLWTYTPYPDEAEHVWWGYLESTLPGYRPEVAARIRPLLARVYETCDEFLGMLLERRPPNTIVALVSDHGMEGLNRVVYVNTVLRRAGLLATDAQGRVDLARTKALYPSINNAYILLNTTDRKSGIVRPEERAQVVTQIRRALAEVRDGGRPVVTGVWDAQSEGARMGIGGEGGGDIYLDLAPGYGFDARLDVDEVVGSREPFGDHLFHPNRASMRTILVFSGPGVARGVRIHNARTIDFAPTLAELLGIARPRNATGRVLREALAR